MINHKRISFLGLAEAAAFGLAFFAFATLFDDKHRLLEIIVNLIQNARQAMSSCEQQVLTLGLGSPA